MTFYVTIAMVIFSCGKINKLFSHVKISCFLTEAHLVFQWCINLLYTAKSVLRLSGPYVSQPVNFSCRFTPHSLMLGG